LSRMATIPNENPNAPPRLHQTFERFTSEIRPKLADDPELYARYRSFVQREHMVHTRMLYLVGEELEKCALHHGVNSRQMCQHLAKEYMELASNMPFRSMPYSRPYDPTQSKRPPRFEQ